MTQKKYTDGSGVSEIWLNIKNYVYSQLLGKSNTGHTHTKSEITDFPSLATVATSGSYNDLSDKPTIPTVNNATLKIQKNGTDVKTFTANASSDVTCNITVPTKVSQLTNDSGFLTSHQSLSNYVTSSNLSTALSDKVDRIDHGYKQITGNGTYSWCKLATITIKGGYINNPISFEVDGRGRERSILQVLFANVSNNDPSLTSFKSDLDTNFYIKKVATSTWELYGNYSEAWGSFTLYRVISSINSNSVAIDTTLSNLSSAPSETTRVSLNISVPTKTSQLTNDSGFLTSVLPVGSYIQFAGSQAPDGFLVCNGGAISRTTYSALFAVIGTTYGSGDGSTTFNLPNLTDRFLQGSSTSGTVKNAGLPNITGSLSLRPVTKTLTGGDGSFNDGEFRREADGLAVSAATFGNVGVRTVGFDASLSSSIYGNSSTVQPPALTCLICIKY